MYIAYTTSRLVPRCLKSSLYSRRLPVLYSIVCTVHYGIVELIVKLHSEANAHLKRGHFTHAVYLLCVASCIKHNIQQCIHTEYCIQYVETGFQNNDASLYCTVYALYTTLHSSQVNGGSKVNSPKVCVCLAVQLHYQLHNAVMYCTHY